MLTSLALGPATPTQLSFHLQVFYPCMGGRSTYADKRGLCEILHDIEPSLCYPLGTPAIRAMLKRHVTSSNSTLWVLKRDAKGMHMHSGKGVSYVHGWDMLNRTVASWYSRTFVQPRDRGQKARLDPKWHQGLVQPYRPPYIGRPPFNRKSELRILLAIVSELL